MQELNACLGLGDGKTVLITQSCAPLAVSASLAVNYSLACYHLVQGFGP